MALLCQIRLHDSHGDSLLCIAEVDGSKILSRIREELFQDRHKIKSTGNGCPGCQQQNKAADGYNPSLGQSGGLFASTGR